MGSCINSLIHFPSLYFTIRFAKLKSAVFILKACSLKVDSELVVTSQFAQGLETGAIVPPYTHLLPLFCLWQCWFVKGCLLCIAAQFRKKKDDCLKIIWELMATMTEINLKQLMYSSVYRTSYLERESVPWEKMSNTFFPMTRQLYLQFEEEVCLCFN